MFVVLQLVKLRESGADNARLRLELAELPKKLRRDLVDELSNTVPPPTPKADTNGQVKSMIEAMQLQVTGGE